ncbi:Methylthioadenosine phosphorylase (MTAP) [Moorella glycerini]|uniref:Probable 6-oxopurine nucleoside phosphorylase n=2 Tax=Neomoorella stamsii TaxID=1266720 RepID=A0A9X7J566_9FIRM|nr:S-methyl-5'-thioinosine phosphorylase [Moorella stamsii]CEP68290.1 Methylthioadenosine phosphorylase (MTAP) [Moorella glycerini]
MRIAIIGGSGVYDPKILADIGEEKVNTPYGEVILKVGSFDGEKIAFLARHGENHSIPPHRINYRANIWALKKIGVEMVLATAAVGSLNPNMQPGDFVFVDQFIDFTRYVRPFTFFEGGETGIFHVDVSEPYCPEIRKTMHEVAQEMGLRNHIGGVYVCTEGPRYETPAEIRAFAKLGGDVVGMTNVPEVVLAHEAGLCYGLVCIVVNMAAGMPEAILGHEETMMVMASVTDTLKNFLMKVVERRPRGRRCRCPVTAGPLKV